MALPANKIKKVKLPNNTEYDIVPSMLQDGTTNNKLSVPTLTQDDNIAIDSKVVHKTGNETISGLKTFQDGIKVGDTWDDKVTISTSQNSFEFYNVDEDESITISYNAVYDNSSYNIIDSSLPLKVDPSITFTYGIKTANIFTRDGQEGLYLEYDNDDGTNITTPGHFTIYGDNDDENAYKPDNIPDPEGEYDLDTTYFNTGITLRDTEEEFEYKLSFPAKSGIFATTSDLTEIVDLTSISSGS